MKHTTLLLAILILALAGCGRRNAEENYPTTDPNDHSPVVHGIDVSHHNELDWKHIENFDKLQFMYAKATEGTTFQDDRYEFHRQFAQKHNLKFGAYHFLTLKSPIDSQFINFKNTSGDFDCLPMLDVEGWAFMQLDTLSMQGIIDRWIELTMAEWGVKPIIYCSPKLYHKIDLRGCLWWADMAVARYATNEPTEEPADDYAIWQFSVYRDTTIARTFHPNGKAVADSVDVNFLRPGTSLNALLMPPKKN